MLENIAARGNARYYESAASVARFSDRYNLRKEEAFCDFLSQFLTPNASILELGGGAGVHGEILARRFDYTHSDRSTAMCHAARQRGLTSLQIDALHIGQARQTAFLAIELSTLRTRDQRERTAQFDAFARSVPVGATLVMSTARDHLHTIDAVDIAALEARGFGLQAARHWGMIPGRVWIRPFARLESLTSCLPFGLRRICVFVRRA